MRSMPSGAGPSTAPGVGPTGRGPDVPTEETGNFGPELRRKAPMTEQHDEASHDPDPAPDGALDVVVRDNPESQTYDALVGDQIAGTMLYEIEGPRLVLTHTAVQERFQHKGVATTLIAAALDDIRRKGKKITILCPIVRTFIDSHPDYADLVDPEHPGVT